MNQLVLVPGVLIGTTAFLAGWFEQRLGRRLAAALPPAITAVAFTLMFASAGHILVVGAAMLLCGFATGLGITQAMNIVVASVPPERVGAFSGMTFVIKAIGSTSGVQIAASMLSTDAASASESPTWGAFCAVFAVGLAVSVACALFGLTLRKPARPTHDSDSELALAEAGDSRLAAPLEG